MKWRNVLSRSGRRVVIIRVPHGQWKGGNYGQRVRGVSGGTTDCGEFIVLTKQNHQFAFEFCARLLRFTVKHHGPVKRKEINPWLRKDAVAEFQRFLSE